jgi:hypothetical protein
MRISPSNPDRHPSQDDRVAIQVSTINSVGDRIFRKSFPYLAGGRGKGKGKRGKGGTWVKPSEFVGCRLWNNLRDFRRKKGKGEGEKGKGGNQDEVAGLLGCRSLSYL